MAVEDQLQKRCSAHRDNGSLGDSELSIARNLFPGTPRTVMGTVDADNRIRWSWQDSHHAYDRVFYQASR